VAFAGSAELKDIQSSVSVVYQEQLENAIYARSTSENLSQNEIEKIKGRILSSRLVEKESKKNHIQQTEFNVADRKMKIANNLCPRCGAELKLRNGKYGQFYGCSKLSKMSLYKKCITTIKWIGKGLYNKRFETDTPIVMEFAFPPARGKLHAN
jgi:hypothetical protein